MRALAPLFDVERAAGRALALGVVIRTSGSTYGKPGTLVAFTDTGSQAGMISGGCLEGDLGERALEVIHDGRARLVHYDLTEAHEPLWGLGMGCGGSLHIVLLRVGPENQWQPLDYLIRSYREHSPACFGVVSASETIAPGTVVLPGQSTEATALQCAEVRDALTRTLTDGCGRWVRPRSRAFELLTVPLELPPRVLILGGGPDGIPVVDLAVRMGWRVTVVDHRAAYADPKRFPAAEAVVHAQPARLAQALSLPGFSAAVIMSHHLDSDALYLRALADTDLSYIGLLGPASRRDRLLAALGEPATASLQDRLRAPVGLPIGGRGPESIALAIIAEVHAHVHAARPREQTMDTTPRRPLRDTVAAAC